MYPFYLGIDLHLKNSYLVLLDQSGKQVDGCHLQTSELVSYVKDHVPPETCAVLEATRNWAYFYDELSALVTDVKLAHPKELKAISSAAVKTDRIDATVLAHLARMNYLPVAYAAPKDVRDLRQYTRHREELVNLRTQAKNRVHAVFAQYQIAYPKSDLFGKGGRKFLDAYLDKVRPSAKYVLENQLALIDCLDELIEETVLAQRKALNAKQKQIQRLLMSIPGVGAIHATTILAEIGEIERFPRAKSLCNWAGLTPRIRNSDQVIRHGHISKQGSPHLRAAMTQAAAVASYRNKYWKNVHDKLVPRCSKKGAKVAVARRLLTTVFYVWSRQEAYREPSA